MTELYTIGVSGHTAEQFFSIISENKIKLVLDIRLFNTSQLSGFSKRDDFEFFLKRISKCGYKHQPSMAPTKSLLDDYKNKKISWKEYEKQFNEILENRNLDSIVVHDLHKVCLLCVEHTPKKCHRRLVAEYFQKRFPEIEIEHL